MPLKYDIVAIVTRKARVEVGFSFGVSVTVSVSSIRDRVVVFATKNVFKVVSPVLYAIRRVANSCSCARLVKVRIVVAFRVVR